MVDGSTLNADSGEARPLVNQSVSCLIINDILLPWHPLEKLLIQSVKFQQKTYNCDITDNFCADDKSNATFSLSGHFCSFKHSVHSLAIYFILWAANTGTFRFAR